MIYTILKTLIRITLSIFFGKRIVQGKDSLPKSGPTILLANHPGTFLDPLIIAAMMNRQVYFLAKGAMFKSKIIGWVFRRFNMIPVYRSQDNKSDMHKNSETFDKCFEHLEKGGVILMFPEGVSITEKKLKPIKTGAARIALGAESRNNFNLGVNIVTIGLNYENPHQFRKDLLVKIADPIAVRTYQSDFEVNEHQAVVKLTSQIKDSLENLIVSIEDKQQERLVDDICEIYTYRIKHDDSVGKNVKLNEFDFAKATADAVNYYANYQRERFYDFSYKVKNYKQVLHKLRLQEQDLREQETGRSFVLDFIKTSFQLILGFPIFLFGLLHNYLPFLIAPRIAKKISKELEYQGPISMVAGMFMYLFLYIGCGIFMYLYLGKVWITLIYVFTLPLAGLFAYWYSQRFLTLRNKWKLMTLFFTKSSVISKLILEREALIKEIEDAKNEFLLINTPSTNNTLV